ncbi:sporulation integral membrane protein YlbJ [Microaerobacter geothermalis]|uniref:sporulation integral membrane protein YlbJ n=1 Tax=Microaerobacter geothermalis TaxID=674972 RepID=UPI001F218E48|nr:sporulation integral membrane protein YlbJ [Microaerobacter geothermalis]MCF6095043.1 sporulation integral membrane protein YlbJ [Microaerobacter geothermalis]
MLQRTYLKTLFFAVISFFLVISLIIYPEDAFSSALRGLKIWWDVVFPALLPFFITSEILMGFGVVHFMGVLLEPFMRPIFNVPGTGAFVLAMGLASGYPIGAKLTARLREQKLISRSEGERLVSFTNTADPLFMFGAVAVGFFQDVSLGIAIALAHYISSLMVGLIMRFHEPGGEVTKYRKNSNLNLFMRALQSMHRARISDGRTIGHLIGDAVTSSMNTMLLIGGFMIIFSVIINILSLVHLTDLIAAAITLIFIPLGIPSELSNAVIAGLFEITLGSQVASETSSSVSMMYKIAIVGAITAWSGFSVHAQVASILSKTDIRYKPYFFARVLHAALAFVVTLTIWKPIQPYLARTSISTWIQDIPNQGIFGIWSRFAYLGSNIFLIIVGLITLSLGIHTWKNLNKKRRV